MKVREHSVYYSQQCSSMLTIINLRSIFKLSTYVFLLTKYLYSTPTEGATSEDSGAPDLNELCEQIRCSLEKREIIEKRAEGSAPDDGLYGQLSLLTHLLKHPLRFKTSHLGVQTIHMVRLMFSMLLCQGSW